MHAYAYKIFKWISIFNMYMKNAQGAWWKQTFLDVQTQILTLLIFLDIRNLLP